MGQQAVIPSIQLHLNFDTYIGLWSGFREAWMKLWTKVSNLMVDIDIDVDFGLGCDSLRQGLALRNYLTRSMAFVRYFKSSFLCNQINQPKHESLVFVLWPTSIVELNFRYLLFIHTDPNLIRLLQSLKHSHLTFNLIEFTSYCMNVYWLGFPFSLILFNHQLTCRIWSWGLHWFLQVDNESSYLNAHFTWEGTDSL